MKRISVIITLAFLTGFTTTCTDASQMSNVRLSQCKLEWKKNIGEGYKLYQNLLEEFKVRQEEIIEDYRIEFGMYSEPRFDIVRKAAQKYPDRRWQMQSVATLMYAIDDWYDDQIDASNAWCNCQSGKMEPAIPTCESMLPKAYEWPTFPDNWQNLKASQTAYSSEYRKNFLSECERTARLSGVKNPLEYCKCTLEELMTLYPSEAEAKNLTVVGLQALAVKCNLFTM